MASINNRLIIAMIKTANRIKYYNNIHHIARAMLSLFTLDALNRILYTNVVLQSYTL